jgi:hypothetical protein
LIQGLCLPGGKGTALRIESLQVAADPVDIGPQDIEIFDLP